MVIDFEPACAGMIRVVAAIGDERLGDPTPCAEYSVKELIGHVSVGAAAFTAVARKEDGAGAEEIDFGDGWRERLAERLRGLAAAWAAPTAWEGRSAGAGIELPNETWGKISYTEILVHGWDLARATGQPYALPEPALRACWAHVSTFLTAPPIPALWGPPVPVPEDAPLLDRILAATGRDPG